MSKAQSSGFLTVFLMLIVFAVMFYGGLGSSLQEGIRASTNTVDAGLWGFVVNNFVMVVSIFLIVSFVALVAIGLRGPSA